MGKIAPVIAVLLVAASGACGGSEEIMQPDVDTDGVHTTYVVSTVDVPTTASEAIALGLDVDGDSNAQPDNALGTILSTLATQGDVDLQETITESVDSGALLLLASMQSTSLLNASGAGLYFFEGANPSVTPCADMMDTDCRRHLQGDASFDLSAGATLDEVVVGMILAGRFTGGPGNVTVTLTLIEGGAPLPLELIGARARIEQVSETGLVSGVLGGAITEAELDATVLPGIKDLIDVTLARDCPSATPPCCTENTTGEVLVSLFDTDDSCSVTVEEIRTNDLIANLLAPDLDLLDGDGRFVPNDDGEPDSLSVGIGFEAVPATFVPPEPPAEE